MDPGALLYPKSNEQRRFSSYDRRVLVHSLRVHFHRLITAKRCKVVSCRAVRIYHRQICMFYYRTGFIFKMVLEKQYLLQQFKYSVVVNQFFLLNDRILIGFSCLCSLINFQNIRFCNNFSFP